MRSSQARSSFPVSHSPQDSQVTQPYSTESCTQVPLPASIDPLFCLFIFNNAFVFYYYTVLLKSTFTHFVPVILSGNYICYHKL